MEALLIMAAIGTWADGFWYHKVEFDPLIHKLDFLPYL